MDYETTIRDHTEFIVQAYFTRRNAMPKVEESNEVKYKLARKLLDIMLRNGLITPFEYKKIDDLNKETFSPELKKVYA